MVNHHLAEIVKSLYYKYGPNSIDVRSCKLCDIADVTNGYAFKSMDLLDKPAVNSTAVFKMGNIIAGGGISHSSTKSWIESSKYPSSKFLSKKGDILMSMTDMKNNVRLLGHTALMDKDNRYFINQRVGIIRSLMDFEWMYIYPLTNSSEFIDTLRSKANSGVQVNLSTESIKNMVIQYPSETQMDNYLKVVNPIFEKIFNLETENSILTQLRDTLLPKLMTGELSVTD